MLNVLALLVKLLPGLESICSQIVQYFEKKAENKAADLAEKKKDTSGLENLFNGK